MALSVGFFWLGFTIMVTRVPAILESSPGCQLSCVGIESQGWPLLLASLMPVIAALRERNNEYPASTLQNTGRCSWDRWDVRARRPMPNFRPRPALRPAAAQRIAAVDMEVFMCLTSCKGDDVSKRNRSGTRLITQVHAKVLYCKAGTISAQMS